MFNSDNLVFNTSEYLEVARGIPYAYWLGIFGFLALSYITRSFAVWKLGRLYGIKNGLFLRSFLPLTRVSAYSLISKSTMGYTPVIRLLSALGNVLYYVFVLGFLFAPTFNVMVFSFIVLCIIYYLRALDLVYLSLGVTGAMRWYWLIPVVGSLTMLHNVGKAGNEGSKLYMKPKNYDTLFKKADEVVIDL